MYAKTDSDRNSVSACQPGVRRRAGGSIQGGVMVFLPLIQAALEIVKIILQGIPEKQRSVTALAWFWAWWPLMKLVIPKEQADVIEKAMKGIVI